MHPKEILSIKEAIGKYDVSISTVRKAIKEGELKSYQRKPNGKRFIRERELLQWLTIEEVV